MNPRQPLDFALAALAALLAAAAPVAPLAAQVLEEIIVTAQKREQPASDVGISISAFGAEQLRALGIRESADLASQTPGLEATSFSGDPTVMLFAIRGVGQNDFVDHHEGPTAIYVGALGAAGFQLFDLERVEVLRGPQGTLFGRNATGGLVHYLSARPSDEAQSYVDLSLAEYNERRLEAAVNGPLGRRTSARLALAANRSDGYVENRLGENVRERDSLAARLQLGFDVSEDLDVLVKLHAARDDDARVGAFQELAAIPGADGLGEFLPLDQNADFFGLGSCNGCDALGYRDADGDPWAGDYDGTGLFNRDTGGGTVTITWDRPGFTLTSVSDHLDLEKTYGEDSDGSPNPLLTWNTFQDARQLSQELRATGAAGGWAWTAGVYYLDIEGDYSNVLDVPLFLAAQSNVYTLETSSWAVFGQLEYDFGDALRLVAGLRYTDDEKDFSYVSSCAGDGCLGFFIFPGLGAVSDIGGFTTATVGPLVHMQDDDYAGKLQLEWRPSDDWLVYGGIARGYKAGSFNAPVDGLLLPAEMRYRPETLTSYDLGFKSTLAAGRLRLNGSAFHYDYDDKQAFTFSGLTTYLLNRPSSIDGLELELALRPAAELELLFGLSLLDASVEPIPLPSGRSADQDMAQAPDVSFNAMLRKGWPLGSGRLSLSLDGSYVAAQYFNTINHPTARAPRLRPRRRALGRGAVRQEPDRGASHRLRHRRQRFRLRAAGLRPAALGRGRVPLPLGLKTPPLSAVSRSAAESGRCAPARSDRRSQRCDRRPGCRGNRPPRRARSPRP